MKKNDMSERPLGYAVVAIPLSRPDIVDFLIPPVPQPRGAKISKLAQRPVPAAEAQWIAQLRTTPNPVLDDLLSIDNPRGYLEEVYTDRLVPVESLAQPNFLTRDLGGWVANFFGIVGLPSSLPADPLLQHLETLTNYGDQIQYFSADPAQVAARLEEEMGGTVKDVVMVLVRLHDLRRQMANKPMAYIERVYAEIARKSYFAGGDNPPLPDMLLFDELLAQMVRLELHRRAALASADKASAEKIGQWQLAQQQKSGLRLILQGEYIIGRHRRSTVLIAPELNAVVKQPGMEPFHEIELSAKFVQGRHENWPYTTHGGAVVTSRGRVRLTLEEDLVPRLNHVFNHNVRYSSMLGLTIEPFVRGKTVQDLVLDDHSQLTPSLYQEIVLHQLVCEVLGIENGDWHAPNFVCRRPDDVLVHIDWGAARPLRPDELTPDGRLSRLNQVSNMAFSFKDPELAKRLKSFHAALLTDENRLTQLRQRAEALASLGEKQTR